MIPLDTRHKMSLATMSNTDTTVINKQAELEADLGDSQFWIDRRVACISGGYPPSEANYVSIQEYVKKLEDESHYRGYLVRDLLPYQDRAVKAEAERDAVAVANCPRLYGKFCNEYQTQRALERAEAELANERQAHNDGLKEYAQAFSAERNALRADAERYRYLKTNARRIDFAGLSWSGGELDARIDAALGEKL